MNKKYFYHFLTVGSLIIFFIFILPITPVHAAAATPTPTPSKEDIQVQNQLITNIASQVAQLHLVEKRGIIGKVADSSNTQITVTDSQNNIRYIDVDALTEFSDPTSTGNFGISDITPGMTIGILGLYNRDSRRILARFVNVLNLPTIIYGEISAIDRNNYYLTVKTTDGKQIIVDIESLTRTYSYTKSTGLVRSGFSKTTSNSAAVIVGVPEKNEKNRMTATRVTFFPEINSGNNTQKTK